MLVAELIRVLFYLNNTSPNPINTNIPIKGINTNNQDNPENPFLHNKLSNQVHKNTYNIFIAKNAKL